MDKNKKYLLALAFIIPLLLIIYIFQINSHESVKGNITVWADENTYDYLSKIAKEFEESNKRANIKVVNISKEEYLDKIKDTEEEKLPNIVHLDFIGINDFKDKIKIVNETNEIIETYNKNFNNNRLKQVECDGQYMGVPLTSKPMALFIREDILNKYGYKVEDINTWNDMFKIGVEIFNKTNGEIRLFSKKDIDNLKLLISAEIMQESNNEKELKANIEKNIKSIFSSELISYYGDSNYVARISSLEIIKELNEELIPGKWICKLPPSINLGANKFYDLGGENLVILNCNNDNIKLIRSFISYAATDIELLQTQLIEGNMFPSSLYTYKDKSLESKVKNTNIQGSSPFVIFCNISERAPILKDYKLIQDINSKIIEEN